METKKFKINGAEKAKGGKNISQKIAWAAGAATIGGFSAGAGYAAMAAAGKKPVQAEKENSEQQTAEVKPEKVEQTQAQQPENTQQQQQQSADEYQPTDNGQVSNNTQQNTSSVQENSVQEEVDPNLVAQSIAQEIDQNDIDGQNVLTIDEFGTANGPDGSEILVAVVHTPDGTQFMLTDTDGDGVFSDVFDMAGNYAGNLEGNLTAGDLIDMYDNSGNYLAMTEEVQGDDPTNGIVNTDDSQPAHETNDVAERETLVSGEQLTDDELLAQLTEDVDDESLIDRLIDSTSDTDSEDSYEDNEEYDYSEDDTEDEIDGGTEDDE